MAWKIQNVNMKLLDKQIKALVKSDMSQELKKGLLDMLSDIYDDRKDGFYDITSVCKDDIEKAWEGNDMFSKTKLKELDDSDMINIAQKMASSFCDDGYWETLQELTRGKVLLTGNGDKNERIQTNI